MGPGAASSPTCCPCAMDAPWHKDARGFGCASKLVQPTPWPWGHRRVAPHILTPPGPQPQLALGAPGAFSFILPADRRQRREDGINLCSPAELRLFL